MILQIAKHFITVSLRMVKDWNSRDLQEFGIAVFDMKPISTLLQMDRNQVKIGLREILFHHGKSARNYQVRVALSQIINFNRTVIFSAMKRCCINTKTLCNYTFNFFSRTNQVQNRELKEWLMPFAISIRAVLQYPCIKKFFNW